MNDWYFRGWEKRTDASGKTKLVYTGEYYAIPGGTKAAKRPCALLTVGFLLLYGLVLFFPAVGGMWRIAAIPQLLTLIPAMYLAIGLVKLLRMGEKLTFRDYCVSWRRMKTASLCALITTGAMAAVQGVFIALSLSLEVSLWRELLYLLGELCCAALCAILFRFIQKHPCSQPL